MFEIVYVLLGIGLGLIGARNAIRSHQRELERRRKYDSFKPKTHTTSYRDHREERRHE